MTLQRWSPVVSDAVTEHVLALRDDESVRSRFESKIDYGFAADDCHVWVGGLSSEGYGGFALPRAGARFSRVVRAHRVAWLWLNGEPPRESPFLDHALTCVGRFCVNPRHLDPVDNDENMRRMLLGPMLGKGPQRALRHAALAARAVRRAAGEDGVF